VRVRTLVADDEPIARAALRDMLSTVEWIEVVGEASSGPATVAAIEGLRPELVFLDIQMPGLLGTEVLRRVTHQPFVVFTTAHAQHAVTAFQLGALDYLLKPFGPDRLRTTLDRVRAALGEPAAVPALDRMSEALANGPMRRLFVRAGAAILAVDVATVTHFEALGDYVTAHTGRARHVVHLALQRLETRLDPARFTRIHRAYIVNLDHVTAFRRSPGGALHAELADGTRLPVSRARARELRGLAV
jgi:two-component system LytT family response regulator